MRGLFILGLLVPFFSWCQVTYLGGSYSVATASGSGASGIPLLSYTATAGTDRVLIFFMVVERDHLPGATGDNWASGAPTGGSFPTVEISTTTLSHLSSQWLYQYKTTDVETDAEISLELMVYGCLEANIPAGTNSFSVTANYSTPANAGDEAIFGALMFQNVDGMSNITNSSCGSCNSISTSNVSPDDYNNAVFSISGASSDRTYSAGGGYTLIGTSSISNTNGNYTDASYSEKDGISVGTQYITSTTDNQTSPFTLSGSADMHGVIESAFRITSPTLLPVELTSFELSPSKNNVLLNWKTSSEINNDRFVIQRSPNGFNWENIDSIQGFGNTNYPVDYEYLDEEPDCKTCYYRLKQVDFDGTSDLSPIRTILTETEGDLMVYPTVSNSRFTFQSNTPMDQIQVFSIDGKCVYHTENTQSKMFQFYPNALNSGRYIVKVQTQFGVATKSIIIP